MLRGERLCLSVARHIVAIAAIAETDWGYLMLAVPYSMQYRGLVAEPSIYILAIIEQLDLSIITMNKHPSKMSALAQVCVVKP